MSTPTLTPKQNLRTDAIDRVLRGTETTAESEHVSRLGAAILNYPASWPLERRIRKVAQEHQLRGLETLRGATAALKAIGEAQEAVTAQRARRRIANGPLRALVAGSPEVLDNVLIDADGERLTSEGLRRALGIVEVPSSASAGWGGGCRMGISLPTAEAIGVTLGLPGWKLESMSDSFLSSWTPRRVAVDVVVQHGWWASEIRAERVAAQACSSALRALGVDRFEEEHTINWVRRDLGLHEFSFETRVMSALLSRLARWQAVADGEIPSTLRRRQLGATVRLARTRSGDVLGRRLVAGWEVSLQEAAAGSRPVVLGQFAAHEPRAAAEALANDFARHA